MKRLFFFAALLLCTNACKNSAESEQVSETSSYEINTTNWPKKVSVNGQAMSILSEWSALKEFEVVFDGLYLVDNKDDLALTLDDLIDKQNDLEASEYPEKFDVPQVKSRQKVLKTYMQKVKGDLHYYKDPQESILQLIEAYNAFRNQFNVIVNNTLDTNLILE